MQLLWVIPAFLLLLLGVSILYVVLRKEIRTGEKREGRVLKHEPTPTEEEL